MLRFYAPPSSSTVCGRWRRTSHTVGATTTPSTMRTYRPMLHVGSIIYGRKNDDGIRVWSMLSPLATQIVDKDIPGPTQTWWQTPGWHPSIPPIIRCSCRQTYSSTDRPGFNPGDRFTGRHIQHTGTLCTTSSVVPMSYRLTLIACLLTYIGPSYTE